MNQTERFEIIKNSFKKLFSEGKKGAFVIFTNPDSGKFVQFAYDNQDEILILDIPLEQLTEIEEDELRKLLGNNYATVAETGEKISFQDIFIPDIERITEFIEKIFVKKFNSPEDYLIETEIELG